MRQLTLVATLLLVACGGEESATLIDDFEARSSVQECSPLAGPAPAAASVAQLQPVSDTTFLLVDNVAREVALLNVRAERVWTFELAEEGPRTVARLSDAALSGDSLLVIADEGLARVRAFDPTGPELWTVDLGFPPQRVAFAAGRLLIAATAMDPRVGKLVHVLEDGIAVPLDVTPATHADGLSRMFLNFVTLQGYPDGRAIVAHQFVEPRAWLVGTSSTERVVVPLPRAVEASLGFVPAMPVSEEDIGRIAAPVIASAPDRMTGDLLYLTRSGRERDGRSEKAIIRADARLGYLGSTLLDVNAVALAYLANGVAIVVDDDMGWFRCRAP